MDENNIGGDFKLLLSKFDVRIYISGNASAYTFVSQYSDHGVPESPAIPKTHCEYHKQSDVFLLNIMSTSR